MYYADYGSIPRNFFFEKIVFYGSYVFPKFGIEGPTPIAFVLGVLRLPAARNQRAEGR